MDEVLTHAEGLAPGTTEGWLGKEQRQGDPMTALGDRGGARMGPSFWGPSDIGQRPQAVRPRLAGCLWSYRVDTGPSLVRVGGVKVGGLSQDGGGEGPMTAGWKRRGKHVRGVSGDSR